jgi:hypothetical protein
MKTTIYAVVRLEIDHPDGVSVSDIRHGLWNAGYRHGDKSKVLDFQMDVANTHIANVSWMGVTMRLPVVK